MGKKRKDMRTDLEKKAKELYFEMSDGTKVRVLDFDLADKPNKYILFFIPGFITVFQSWHKCIEILSKDFRILYFESREKNSSIIPSRKLERNVTLEIMAHDLKEVIEQLDLDKKDYISVNSSAGGTIEVIALSNEWLNPKGAIMVGPSIVYHTKLIIIIFMHMIPQFLKPVIMPLVKWYLTRKYVDKKAEPEQLAKYMRSMEEVQLRRIRKGIRRTRGYNIQHLLPKIKVHCILIGASSDKMHAAEETLENSKLIPNAKYIDLKSNKAAHDQPLVDVIFEYIQDIENGKI